MKKYLMTGIVALAMGGMFTSCSHDMSIYSGSQSEQILQKYEQTFVQTFGEPASTQTWGFGSSTTAGTRGMTRSMPDQPTFRDTNPITKPTMPTYSNTVPGDAIYARDYQNYQKGDIIYINTEFSSLNNPQNTEDLTIYVDGNVTYSGGTNQNGNGTVFCVTENSTLKLGAVSNNLIVYLAPGATLDVTEGLNWDGTPAVDWVWNPNTNTTEQVPRTSFSFQNPHAAIYLSAGSTLKAGDLTLINGAKLLNDGGTIEAKNLTLDQQATLWNEGFFTVENNLTITNTSSLFYNAQGKTITVKGNLDLINNDCLLYNDGTVNVTNDIILHNTDAEIVNNGTLTGASYSQAAGGKMHNVGTATITGKTDLTNSNSKWMNDGQYTSGSFDVDNYSKQNYNNCKLTVNGNFHLNRGEFVLNSGASVVTETFTWEDTSNFYLGSKSLLKVNGTLLTQNYNSDYGFRGYGDDYAVIQAESIAIESNEQFRMSYFGKLYIATDNHFAQWYKDAPNTNQPCYYYENTVKFSKDGDASPVTIPASECNPGFSGSHGGGNQDVIETIRIIAEDLTVNQRSDFDFNDVVFDVMWNTTKNTVSIKLLAAGGELPIYIGNDDNAREIHELFSEANPTRNITVKTMMNTYQGQHNSYSCPEVLLDDNWWSGNNIQDIANSIMLRVQKSGTQFVLKAPKGEAPSKIAVGTDYEWCDERQDIEEKYGSKFTEYVGGAHSWNTWYK